MNNEEKQTPVLEVNNLKKFFKIPGKGFKSFNFHAVDGISFNIYKKEVFGLVGESGCGKTTSGRTIIRLYKPTSGYVKLNGEIIAAGYYDLVKELRKKRKEYNFLMLSQNPRKYRKYEICEQYNKKIKDLKKARKQYKANLKQEIEEILTEKNNYNKLIYGINSKAKIEIDKLVFNHKQNILNLKKQLINASLYELKLSKKQLLINYKNKVNGIKDSNALTKTKKLELLENAKQSHLLKLLALENSFAQKVLEDDIKKTNKSVIRNQIKEAKKNFKEAKLNIYNNLKLELEQHKSPDFKEIVKKVVIKKKELYFSLFKHIKDYFKLNCQKNKELRQNKEKNITNDKYYEYKQEFSKIRSDILNKIKCIKRQHSSKAAQIKSRQMQMIFQDPISSLNPRMTVQEIISEGLIISGQKNKAENRKKVEEVLRLVGLAPEYITRYPHEFSGGQRQRIGIARALIMNPSMIIADEPISALDVSIQAQVINLLKDLKEKLDLTILFIAHDLSVVKFFSDRIGVMYMGKMMEMASSEELFAHPLHPYTKSLLSAIPQPDPDYEKTRQRIYYNPMMHDYSEEKPQFVEIKPGHFVLANSKEIEEMKKELGE